MRRERRNSDVSRARNAQRNPDADVNHSIETRWPRGAPAPYPSSFFPPGVPEVDEYLRWKVGSKRGKVTE